MNKLNINTIDLNGGSGGGEVLELLGEGFSKDNTVADVIEANEEIIAKSLCDLNDRTRIKIETSIPSTGMVPDTVYNLGDITEDPDVTIQEPTELTKDHEYTLIFNIGATAPDTITFPEDVIFTDTPSWDTNSHYEINIKWDIVKELYYALVQSWEIEEEV